MTDIPRQPNGKFAKGPRNVDIVRTPEQKEKIRQLALARADIDYRPISINGVVFANITRAAKHHGIAAATLRRYALSDKDLYKHVFFTQERPTPGSEGSGMAPGGRTTLDSGPHG